MGEPALRVALDQVALLKAELETTPRLVLCRTFAEIEQARREGRIALLLTMEGAEPLGDDLNLLHIFHELGLRAISLTHARANAAAAGGIFAATGSPTTGLTSFGREVVQECERLGIMLDLAHINPAGFEEICALTSKPLIVSHTNARHFYDIERNISDEQIKMIGARGGVIGINAILVSRDAGGGDARSLCRPHRARRESHRHRRRGDRLRLLRAAPRDCCRPLSAMNWKPS